MTAYDDAQIERFDTLEVEGFTLSDSDSSRGATPHFERHPDLGRKVRKALKDNGDEQAVLVISLGIDDHDTHLGTANRTAPAELVPGRFCAPHSWEATGGPSPGRTPGRDSSDLPESSTYPPPEPTYNFVPAPL